MSAPDWPTAIEDLKSVADIMREQMARPQEMEAIRLAENVTLLRTKMDRPLLIPQWLADMSDPETIAEEARLMGFDGYEVYEEYGE